METSEAAPENTKCPYCGADNSVASEFCGVCFKNLHIPAGVRAEEKARKIIAAAALSPAQAGPAQGRPAFRLWARLVLIAGLLRYYLQWYSEKNHSSFLDLVNLPFHEAGHVAFSLFPQFLYVAGGTIGQLLVPALCLAHLLRRGANLGWQLCLFWIGENLLNISVYAGDALNQALPLVGGGCHDWTYLLTEMGLIAHTRAVARTIFAAGSLVIFLSFYFIGRDALNRESIETGGGGPG
jgi:hypothetical protein